MSNLRLARERHISGSDSVESQQDSLFENIDNVIGFIKHNNNLLVHYQRKNNKDLTVIDRVKHDQLIAEKVIREYHGVYYYTEPARHIPSRDGNSIEMCQGGVLTTLFACMFSLSMEQYQTLYGIKNNNTGFYYSNF